MSGLGDTTTNLPSQTRSLADADLPALALAIAWSVHEPRRIGEIAFLTGRGPLSFGRQGSLRWLRHRPGTIDETGPLPDPGLSREQLVFERTSGAWTVRRTGRLELRINHAVTERGPVEAGDVLEVGDRWVLLVHARPEELPGDPPTHPFGEPDANGLIGEGPSAYALRARAKFVALRTAHVLVTGESGTGKELVARAVHAMSPRSRGPLISRSAATIPESLADAELFGNLPNYPNPGMAGRPGLAGEADGGTLFLDEFGELPLESQARLLRLLDDGDYTRLGEARARRADLRLVAATNRSPDHLKHDVLARLPLRITVPPLQARKEDIPLLLAHLLRETARREPDVAGRFFTEPDHVPRLSTRWMVILLRHPYATHVRELTALMWRSLASPTGDVLDVVYGDEGATPGPAEGGVESAELTPEILQACLDRFGGRQDLAWRALGLSSRHVLARLVKKHGLVIRSGN